MNKNLIFDIGMHRGEDTAYYLSKGYNVVAVDADPSLISSAENTFSEAYENGRLCLENLAISEGKGELDFYRSEKSIWNSLNNKIADRLGSSKEVLSVKSATLQCLIDKYGLPYYCKIDIEGYDIVALRSLSPQNLPKYISVESECLGEADQPGEEEVLATLDQLNKLGYSCFKLVDQKSLKALNIKRTFYKEKKNLHRLKQKFKTVLNQTYRQKLSSKENYVFPSGASGPFGELIEGSWYCYEDAKKMILKHRKDFFETHPMGHNFSFWCDWHAKLE